MIRVIGPVIKDGLVSVIIEIPSAAASYLPTLMDQAKITEIEPGSEYGYIWDHASGTVTIILPIGYQDRIDEAIALLKQKYHQMYRSEQDFHQGWGL